jgi:hypothetical protein
LQCEKERLAKDAKDVRNKFVLLLQLINSRIRVDLAALLSSNLQVPMPLPSVSILVPSLPGVPSIACLLAGGALGFQLIPFILDESLFCLKILESLSYP